MSTTKIATETTLHFLKIKDFTTESGVFFNEISLSYQLFGKKLGKAPVVLINHALTGNSNVAGKNGWWKDLIGNGKAINTTEYTVLAFNIPGNGFDGVLIKNYKSLIARDIAKLFLIGLEELKIKQLFALIGGSLGGGIAWEMAVLNPIITQHLIPIATDWKATDWLIANCQIQEQFLENSKYPVHDARMHAMLCYRTPASFNKRFKRSKNTELEIFNVESWLLHHGKKLQERFQLAAYKLMNQLLRSIDVTNHGEKNISVLDAIDANIYIIGVNSDLFFTAEENKQTYKRLAITKSNVIYNEINSDHGHDAFLIEHEQLEKFIAPIFNKNAINKKLKIIKFGGKSLSNGEGLKKVTTIIKGKVAQKEHHIIVVSARGNTTDQLEAILENAKNNLPYQEQLIRLQAYQKVPKIDVDLSLENQTLETLFKGVFLLKDYSQKIKDEVLAQGEVMAAKTIAAVLQINKINAIPVDARSLLKTDNSFGEAQLNSKLSKENVINYFKTLATNSVPIVTGFIASNSKNETTTLGRNGSNYTASLLANFLHAEELQNYTHVNGIYTANPDLVKNAKKIEELSYSEANELANFGTTILHAKTIIPLLEKNIKLRILNTYNLKDKGTLISSKKASKGITSISVLDNRALISFEGRGLLGKVGVDARIFKTLSARNISVSIISQGSSERGIGFVIDAKKAEEAVVSLKEEFDKDFYTQDVTTISVIDNVAIISIVGQDLSEFHHPYSALINNNIKPLLFNNAITGKNVSIVLKNRYLQKAVNVLHEQIFKEVKIKKTA